MTRILAIDIGGGTQDILVYDSDKLLENCVQMILPSPTVLVAKQIERATQAGKALYLDGYVMGGGPAVKAIRDHLKHGLPVFAAHEAALTIDDDIEAVKALGVEITDAQPNHTIHVHCGDIQYDILRNILSAVDEDMPSQFAVAVQDHGYSPHESNRMFRFLRFERFMADGGKLDDLAYTTAPEAFTRMQAVQKQAPGAMVMDTGSAALLGALTDRTVKTAAAAEPVAIINVGNQHTFAALIHNGRMLGVFEHHTRKIDSGKLEKMLLAFLAGTLTNEDVFHDGGHGCVPVAKPVKPALIVVTGPQRLMLEHNPHYYFAAPQGNMMLMGSFGLVAAAQSKITKW